MTNSKMKKLLEERLTRAEWAITYNKEEEKLRIEEKETKKGITLSLNGLVSKWHERKESIITEVVEYVEEALTVMTNEQQLSGKEKAIFPVIRSTSFPMETKQGEKVVYDDHTAETRIFYALDLGKSYRLIDEGMLQKEGWNAEKIKEAARFNLRSLEHPLKKEEVAGNTFYFLNSNDGYDASRILNQALLQKMEKEAKGKLAVAVPHQDVLIFVDVQNDVGYDILAQMAMKFFAEGRVPITALSFLYENGELEPIFILAKNKPKK
jgi:uncharacterized protein YtpQ (UPF0354 family)